MCTIKSSQGRAWPPPKSLWNNNVVVSLGSSVLVDGAKCDRTIWAGDLGVSIPSAFASTNDLDAIKNAMDTLYSVQKNTGELPWSGPVFNLWGSDTYHLWTLLGSALYYDYTQNTEWLTKNWPRINMKYRYQTT
ncbi:MET18 [Acrasis kona]|uniref:MET18 n=1 Tax=Acrasis kona TaxID=1008807 RepID=A0AAW2Z7I8_9EUKA